MEQIKKGPSEAEALRAFFRAPVSSQSKRLKCCLVSTLVLGLIAHGFGLLNLTIGHDSLTEFSLAMSANWKIALGRFMEPLLRYLMGEIITLPWLAGLTGLLFIGLSAHLISKMFSLDTVWENILLSGLCVTWVTVTAVIATYVHDFAGDMLALLLAVLGAYLWTEMQDKLRWKPILLGGLCLDMSFGFYQSYLAVMITLLCIRSLVDLLEGRSAKDVLLHLLRAAPMGILALALYFGCVGLSLKLFGLELAGDEGNNLSYIGSNLSRLLALVKEGYYWVISDLVVPNATVAQSIYTPGAVLICLGNVLALVLAAGTVLKRFKAMGWKEISLALILAAIAPACMVCVGFVSTVFHHLTRYAVCLYYLILLLILRLDQSQGFLHKFQRVLTIALVCLVILSSIQMANAAYEKKDLERQATLSTMTRVLDRLEQYEDYVYGESTVAILGAGQMHGRPLDTGSLDLLSGLELTSQITYRQSLEGYFANVLQYPIHICTDDQEARILQSPAYAAMGVFPAADSIATIDGIVVVKLAENTG